MVNRSLITCLLVCWSAVAQAAWPAYWPISDYNPTSPTPTPTYANFMEDLFNAANERCKATATDVSTATAYIFNGSTFTPTPTSRVSYAVDPIEEWAPRVTYYSGITPDITYEGWGPYTRKPPVESSRLVVTYTNGTWITNKTVAVIVKPTGGTVTNVLSSQLVYVNGQYVTNKVYDVVYTNKIPKAEYVVTGKAFDLLRYSRYTLTNDWWGDSYWPSSETYPWFSSIPTSETFYYLMTPTTYEVTPEAQWLPVYGPNYVRTKTVVTTNLPVYLYSVSNRSYTATMAAVTYTNYGTTTAVMRVGSTPTYTSAGGDYYDWTLAAGDTITLTNTYRVEPGNYGAAMDTLLSDIDDLISECIDVYADSTNATADSFDNFYATERTWVWYQPTIGQATWRNQIWGTPDPVPNMQPIVPDLPHWNSAVLMEYTGAGTNLYRKYTASLNPPAQPGLNHVQMTDWSGIGKGWWIQHEGWEYGETNVQYTNVWMTTATEQTEQGVYLAYPKQTWMVPLGSFKYQAQYELTLTARGFSPVFWYTAATSNSPTIFTNQQWIADLNNQTATRQNEAVTPVFTIPYYTIGSAFIMPLVDVTRNHVVRPAPINTEVEVKGWFIISDKAAGMFIATNWANMFDPDVGRAVTLIHQLGYPTRVQSNKIGCPSMGPSGYYYPGGVLRPVTYQLGVMGQPGLKIGQSSYYDSTAYPLCLDYVTWDDLLAWPTTVVRVSKAGADTAGIRSIPLSVTGNVLVAYGDALAGYSFDIDWPYTSAGGPVVASETLNVAAPGVFSTANNYIYFNNISDSLSSALTVGLYGYYAYSTPVETPVTTVEVNRDEVWNVTNSPVVDTYYIAGISRVTTTSTYRVSAAITNTVTNVVILPRLIITNETLSIDTTCYLRDTVVSLVMSNELALYTMDPILNPCTLDGRYKVLNELKYLQSAPIRFEAIYDAWRTGTGPSATVAPYWSIGTYASGSASEKGEYFPPTPPYVDYNYTYQPVNFNMGYTEAAGNGIIVTNSDVVWTVDNDPTLGYVRAPWVIEGSGYYDAGWPAGYNNFDSDIVQVPAHPGPYWPFDIIPDAKYTYTVTRGNIRAYGGNITLTNPVQTIAGKWAKEVRTVIPVVAGMAYVIDRYMLSTYHTGDYLFGANAGFSNGYNHVYAHGTVLESKPDQVYAGAVNYTPLHATLKPGELVHVDSSVFPASAVDTRITNTVSTGVATTMDLSWVTQDSFSASLNAYAWDDPPPVFVAQRTQQHAYNYTVKYLKPYRYTLQQIKYVRKPVFTYTP